MVLLATGSAGGVLATRARADTYSDNDLAYLRLLIAIELLGADFYGNAIEAQPYGKVGQAYLTRAAFNEGEHYASLAGFLTASGGTPATADDIDFSYPAGSYTTVAAVTKLAVTLESLFLGSYLGAIGGVQNPSLAQPLARIAANQAQHLAVFSELLGRKGFDDSFPAPLSIDEATTALAVYTS